MEFKFDNGSCSSEQISYINATFGEDNEEMIGVCRITGLEIECDESIPYEIKTKVETQIFNYLAGYQYFTENPNWKEEAENDISDYTGVSNVYVDWE